MCLLSSSKGYSVVIHGDDFTALGSGDNLLRLTEELTRFFEFKLNGIIGPCPTDQEHVRVLNRVVTLDDRG